MGILNKTITLACAAGAILLTPATLGLTGVGAALAAFGAGFFSDHVRRKLNLNDIIAQISRKASSGELPPNHDIERAAQEAYLATLLILAEYLESTIKVGDGQKWLKNLCGSLKKAKDAPPAPWPDFSTDNIDTLESLWRHQGEVFADELCITTKTWFRVFEVETKTTVPQVANAAIEHGWKIGDKYHTLSSVWTECFRYQIKHSEPAATAHLFGTLAQLAGSQKELLADVAGLQDQLEGIAQQLQANNHCVLDELAAIKQSLPAPEDLKHFNERLAGLADRLDVAVERIETAAGRIEFAADDIRIGFADLKDGMRAGFDDIAKRLEVGNGMSPAELAVVQDWISRQFVQVGSRNKRGLSLVHFAAKDGRRDVLAWLKTQAEDVNAKDNDGQTPMFYAATVGHDEVIVWLRTQGADVNARDKDDKTPMHYAARRDQLGSMKILKANGADVNAKDNNDQTPIFSAVIANRVNAMCWLKAEGANIDVNARDKNGKTLMDYAAQYDCSEAIRWLRKQGENV